MALQVLGNSADYAGIRRSNRQDQRFIQDRVHRDHRVLCAVAKPKRQLRLAAVVGSCTIAVGIDIGVSAP
jgi:hypothetical protein